MIYSYFRAEIDSKTSKDAKETRRFRNIVANSGLEMESGEVRDIQSLYVMSRAGKLIRIGDLASDPDSQKERYKVNFATNHGHIEPDGEYILTVEDLIGDAKVWLEEDGLHARVYFANDDPKSDHAWSVSDNASYSIGTEWYSDGYYGAGIEIDKPIGILREISMVETGNDPRAYTLDHKTDSSKAQGSEEEADGKTNQLKGDLKMNQKLKKADELTPDEARRLHDVIDELTADIPASEEEPTRRESKDSEENPAESGETTEKAEEKETTTSKDVLHNTVLVVRDKAVKQETATTTKDWRFSNEAKQKFAELAGKIGKFDNHFTTAWMQELKAHKATTNDGITGLGLPVDINQLVIDAVSAGETDSTRILDHFRQLGGNGYLINLIQAVGAETGAETARAHGHKKGDTKINQSLTATPRAIYNKMVYKKLDLDALEVKENPELVEIRARELVMLYLAEIARAAVIGDGRTAPAEGQPDYRMFDGTRGFYSIAADASATEGIGTAMAKAITMASTKNLYDASIEADSEITAEGGLVYIAKKSAIKAYRQATKANGDYVVAPGARIEDSLNAVAVYTPDWMKFADVDVVVFANNQYGLTGDANPETRTDFDLSTNQNVMLVEGARGGSLIAKNAAVTITFEEESE